MATNRGARMKEIFAKSAAGEKVVPMTDAQRKRQGLPTREEAKYARESKQIGSILRKPIKVILEAADIAKNNPELRRELLDARGEEFGTKGFMRRGNPNLGKGTKRRATSGKKRGRPSKVDKQLAEFGQSPDISKMKPRRGRPPGSGKKQADESLDEMWARAGRETAAELGTMITKSGKSGKAGKRGRGRPPGSKNKRK